MSCNLIGGMYQRLDKMRKAAFASACLFGTDNDSTISGIWVWRGQDLAFSVINSLNSNTRINYDYFSKEKYSNSLKVLVKLATL